MYFYIFSVSNRYIYLPICLTAYLSIYPSMCTSISLFASLLLYIHLCVYVYVFIFRVVCVNYHPFIFSISRIVAFFIYLTTPYSNFGCSLYVRIKQHLYSMTATRHLETTYCRACHLRWKLQY